MEDIFKFKPGDVIYIVIYDYAEGKAKVIKNNSANKALTFQWLEEPSMCYRVQARVRKGEEVAVKYDDIAKVKIATW